MNATENHPRRTRLTRLAALAAAVAIATAGCQTQTFPWAHQDCARHGGLHHVGKVGYSFIAECNDGTWVSN